MTLKDYHFTDEQIDTILRVMRDTAFRIRFQVDCEKFSQYNELANLIEDQIVNHPTND